MEPFPSSSTVNDVTSVIDGHQLQFNEPAHTSLHSHHYGVATKLPSSANSSNNGAISTSDPAANSYAASGASQLAGGGKREWELYNIPLPLQNINLNAPINPLHSIGDAHPMSFDGVHAPTSGTIQLDDSLLKRCAMPPGRSVLCYSPNMDFTLYVPQELLHCTQGLISFLNDFNQVGPNRIKVKPSICGKYYEHLLKFMNANPKRPIVTGVSSSSRGGVQQTPEAVLRSFIAAVPEGFEVPELQPQFEGGSPLPIAIPARLHSTPHINLLPPASYTYVDALCRNYVNSRDDICPLGSKCPHLHPFILMTADVQSPNTNLTSGEDDADLNEALVSEGAVKKAKYTHVLHPRIGYNQSHRRLPDGSAAAPYPTLPPGVVFQISLPNQHSACMAVSSNSIYLTNGSKIHYDLVVSTENHQRHLDGGLNSTSMQINNRGKISRHRATTIMQHCAHYTKNGVCCLGADCQFVHMANFSLPADPPAEKRPVYNNSMMNTSYQSYRAGAPPASYTPSGSIMLSPNASSPTYSQPMLNAYGYPTLGGSPVPYQGALIPTGQPIMYPSVAPFQPQRSHGLQQAYPIQQPAPHQQPPFYQSPPQQVGQQGMPPQYLAPPQHPQQPVQGFNHFGYLPPQQHSQHHHQHAPTGAGYPSPQQFQPPQHQPQQLLTVDPTTGLVVPMNSAQIAAYYQQASPTQS
eukprot:GILI01004671.1.p1 GENE.GILI01004671.1~~GILI01004671.1.p1  ORF type:complete len:691 (-),score=106.39 GILI01004671.1:72-2144(-)